MKRESTTRKRSHAALKNQDAETPRKEATTRADSVKPLNALKSQDFQERYLSSSEDLIYTNKLDDGMTFGLSFKPAADLSNADLEECLGLIEVTSRSHYEPSSFGWHPRRKRREMQESEMRYITVSTQETDADHAIFGGFLSFMLTHDSTPSVPVLYVYELHLTPATRGRGLGLHLMAVAERIAQRTGMEKVMLTCFVANHTARRFYASFGFEVDVSSPQDRRTRNKTSKVDYVILSKNVQAAETYHSNLRAVQTANET